MLDDYKKEFVAIRDNANLVTPEASFEHCSVDEMKDAFLFMEEMIKLLRTGPAQPSRQKMVKNARTLEYLLAMMIDRKQRFGH